MTITVKDFLFSLFQRVDKQEKLLVLALHHMRQHCKSHQCKEVSETIDQAIKDSPIDFDFSSFEITFSSDE